MELIKRLKREEVVGKNGKYYKSIGLFKCPYCDNMVKKESGHGKRDKSCGCNRVKLITKNHGTRTHCGTGTKLYDVYINMKARCRNKRLNIAKYYVDRGIDVCEEWKKSYGKFRNWSLDNGYREGLTIDRIDNNGNYEPCNCRWITQKENSRNSRNCKLNMDIANEIRELKNKYNYTNKYLSRIYNVSGDTISNIINYKIWS